MANCLLAMLPPPHFHTKCRGCKAGRLLPLKSTELPAFVSLPSSLLSKVKSPSYEIQALFGMVYKINHHNTSLISRMQTRTDQQQITTNNQTKKRTTTTTTTTTTHINTEVNKNSKITGTCFCYLLFLSIRSFQLRKITLPCGLTAFAVHPYSLLCPSSKSCTKILTRDL